MFKTFAVALGILLLAASPGEASVRDYFAPAVEGTRLDACLNGRKDCGKPAADAFCVKEGYTGAIVFQREAAGSATLLVPTDPSIGIEEAHVGALEIWAEDLRAASRTL